MIVKVLSNGTREGKSLCQLWVDSNPNRIMYFNSSTTLKANVSLFLSLLMPIHFWQSSYQHQKAAANALTAIPFATPSYAMHFQAVLVHAWCLPARHSWSKTRRPPVPGPASRMGAVCDQPALEDVSSVDQSIVPVEIPLLRQHLQPLDPQLLQ